MNMFKAKHILHFTEHIYFHLLLHNNNNYIWAYKGTNGMNMFKAKHILHFTEHIYFHLLLHNNNNYICAYRRAWIRINTIYTLRNTYNFIYYYTITTIIYVHVRGQMEWTCLRLNTIYILRNTYISIYYYTITTIIYEHISGLG